MICIHIKQNDCSSSSTLYADDAELNLYGYVDFVEGKQVLRDKVWFTGILRGIDSDYIVISNE